MESMGVFFGCVMKLNLYILRLNKFESNILNITIIPFVKETLKIT